MTRTRRAELKGAFEDQRYLWRQACQARRNGVASANPQLEARLLGDLTRQAIAEGIAVNTVIKWGGISGIAKEAAA